MQYQGLPAALRTVVNRLIHLQKELDSGVEWSCVYVKNIDLLLEALVTARERELNPDSDNTAPEPGTLAKESYRRHN